MLVVCRILIVVGLSSILLLEKVFGASVACLFLISVVTVDPRHYLRLTGSDYLFIATLSLYPLVVMLRSLASDTFIVSELDNPSRFLLIIPVYLWMRVQGAQLPYVIVGAALACFLNAGVFGYEFLSGTTWTRIYGHENSVTFAQVAFLLTTLALIPAALVKEAVGNVRKMYCIGILALGLVSVLVSQTRTVVIISPLLLLAVVFFSDTYVFSRREKLLSAVVVSLVGYWVFMGGSFLRMSELLVETQELLINRSIPAYESSQVRIALWQVGWDIFQQNIWTGVGKGEFHSAAESIHRANPDISNAVLGYRHAHNEFLNLGVELGISGMAAILVTMTMIPLLSYKGEFSSESRYLLVITVMSWWLFGTTDAVLENHKITLLIVFMLCIGFAEGLNTKFGRLDE